jgi:DNA-binding winged helix-turn-helix (wHTH) protein/tetratricopeptide (TPR) repeat protein
MPEQENELYEFGQFRLDVAERSLVRSDTKERVQLPEKAFETLCVLVRNAGHLVDKNELLRQVWADSFVEENNLNKCIHAVRRALGETNGGQQFIETIKKHGFRFVAEVRRVRLEKTVDALEPENGSYEAVLPPSSSPSELVGQEIDPQTTSAKSNSANTRLASSRLRLAALGLAVLLIGASAFGFYFYKARTNSGGPTPKRGTTNQEAYGFYLQGKTMTFNRTPGGTRKAVECFEHAVRRDPKFAQAYSGMAHALIASGNLGGGLPRVDYERAKEVVQKALALDNNLAEGYAVLGELKFTYDWDFAGAEKDLLRAIELDRNCDLAHEQYASYLVARGRFEEAIAEIKTALEIDPNSFMYQLNNGRILYQARRYDEAVIQLKRLIEVNEDYAIAYSWLWLAYEMKGDDAQAYEWFLKWQKLTNPERIELFKKAYETSGWQAVRQKACELNKLNDLKPSANYYAIARQCTLMGDKEQAFEYLNKAIAKRQGQMIMLNVDPPFDNLRTDPRFDELVRRVGLK